MSTFQLSSLPKEQRIKYIGQFYDAMLLPKSHKDIRNVFRDLLTPNEIAMLIRRIQIATLLLHGVSQESIVSTLSCSYSKVTKVKRSLERNGEGYKFLAKKLKHREGKEDRSRYTKSSDMARGLPGALSIGMILELFE